MRQSRRITGKLDDCLNATSPLATAPAPGLLAPCQPPQPPSPSSCSTSLVGERPRISDLATFSSRPYRSHHVHDHPPRRCLDPAVRQDPRQRPRAATVTVGRLGRFRFPPGVYVYTGSARRNLEARSRRHLSRTKNLHWHSDYLLADPAARIVAVRRFRAAVCAVNQRTKGRVGLPARLWCTLEETVGATGRVGSENDAQRHEPY